MNPTKIAIIQDAPVHFSLEESLQKVEQYISDAAAKKANIIVFGECWLCGYPGWIDICPDVARWDHPPVKEAWSILFQNGITVPGPAVDRLSKAAKEHKVILIIGVNEVILKGKGNNTVYNSILTFDQQGVLVNHHRKLMPTFNEKLIYGLGDGAGLHSVDTPFGKIGSLVCWEHWMPLTRQAMHDEGEDIHFALWPYVKKPHIIASQQYAFEGKCFVVSVGQIMKASAIPSNLPSDPVLANDDFVLRGGSCVIGPDTEFVLEPVYDHSEILYCELPPKESLIKEKMNLAVSGHYQRPDVFQLDVNKSRHTN